MYEVGPFFEFHGRVPRDRIPVSSIFSWAARRRRRSVAQVGIEVATENVDEVFFHFIAHAVGSFLGGFELRVLDFRCRHAGGVADVVAVLKNELGGGELHEVEPLAEGRKLP